MSLESAVAFANSRVGTEGYGNNGCTEWVRRFLLELGHPLGQYMTDGSQGNLMWVPNLMDWAKANGMWKEPEEGGACGDVCLLETNGDCDDGADHVVIATGDGDYWGNSSSRNQIVRRNIAYDYGGDAVWGYVTTGSGNGAVSKGNCGRSMAEIVGDAGSTSGNAADWATDTANVAALRVFINPGHSSKEEIDSCLDHDHGASGFGMYENEKAKQIADLVAGYLTAAGVQVIDVFQNRDLHTICQTANNAHPEADLFISIHCNSYDTAANGTETFYYYNSTNGKKLATCINKQIVDSIDIKDRGAKPAEPGRNGIYVLSNTDAVAVLVECAFIDNAHDNELLRDKYDDFARAIARGVTDYESGI